MVVLYSLPPPPPIVWLARLWGRGGGARTGVQHHQPDYLPHASHDIYM